MKNETNLKDSPKEIFNLLVRLLMSLEVGETVIKAVIILLPEHQQRYKLMEWISEQAETREPTGGEILQKALEMSEQEK